MEEPLYNFYKLFVESSLLEDLYLETLLTPLTVTALVIALVVAFAFYIWPLNRVSFSGLGHWLIMLAISGAAMFLVAFVTCVQKADQQIPRDEADPDQGTLFDQGSGVFFTFGAEMLLLTALLFFVVSMFMKGASRNAKHRPMLWPSR